MVYTKKVWVDGTPAAPGTAILAADMDRIEQANVDGDLTNPDSVASVSLSATYATKVQTNRIAAFPKAQGAICFTWDDGFSNWLQLARDAAARGQRHTFCVTTNRIDAPAGITAADILAIRAMGHEIASHSAIHSNHATATVAEREAEYASQATLEALLGEPVTTYVYPVGSLGSAANATTDKEIFGRFERVLDTNNVSRVQVSDRLGAFVIPRSSWRVGEVKSLIEFAARTPVIYTVFGHGPGVSGITGEITYAYALEIMDLAAALGVPCVTTKEAFPGGNLLANPNFNEDTLGAWRKMGSETAVSLVPAVTPPAGFRAVNLVRVTSESTVAFGVKQLYAVEPGKSYTLAVRARVGADGAGDTFVGSGMVLARVADATGYTGNVVTGWHGTSNQIKSTAGTTDGTWNLLTLDYTVPAGVAWQEAQLVVTGETGITAEFSHVWFGESKFGNFA